MITFTSPRVYKPSSTADIAPRDYEHIYRNVKVNAHRNANPSDYELAAFVVDYVSDFISRQETDYRR